MNSTEYSSEFDLINRQQAEIEKLSHQLKEGIDLAKQIPELLEG